MTDITQELFTVEEGLKKVTFDHDQYVEIVDQTEVYKYSPYRVVVNRIDRSGDLILQNFSVKDMAEAVEIANRMTRFIGPHEDEELTVEQREVLEAKSKRAKPKVSSVGIK